MYLLNGNNCRRIVSYIIIIMWLPYSAISVCVALLALVLWRGDTSSDGCRAHVWPVTKFCLARVWVCARSQFVTDVRPRSERAWEELVQRRAVRHRQHFFLLDARLDCRRNEDGYRVSVS